MVPNNATSPISISDFPDKLLRRILRLTPVEERLQYRQVSRQWNKVVNESWPAVETIRIIEDSDIPHEETRVKLLHGTLYIGSPLPKIFDAIPDDYNDGKWKVLPTAMRTFSVPVPDTHKEIVAKIPAKCIMTYFIDQEFIDLVGHKIELEKLNLYFHAIPSSNITLSPILNLKNLQTLSLWGLSLFYKGRRCQVPVPLITDDLIKAVAMHLLHLKILWLGASEYVTDDGLKCLATLQDLDCLGISNCVNVRFTILGLFTKLRSLFVYFTKVDEGGLIELIQNTPTLEFVFLQGISITTPTVMAAIEATMQRTNESSLRMLGSFDEATISRFGTTPTPRLVLKPITELTVLLFPQQRLAMKKKGHNKNKRLNERPAMSKKRHNKNKRLNT